MNPDEAVLLWVDEYSRMAERYEENVVPRFAPFARRLVEGAALKPHATVLDVSTGTGLTAVLAAEAIRDTGLVVAIDLSDGALAVAQTKAARAGLRSLRFELLDSRNIVYRGGTFDAVLSSFGLPSVGHEQTLREIARVLKDGATFRLVEWAARDAPSGWDAWEEVVGRHRTTQPSNTLAQLREAGDLLAKSGDFDAIRDPAKLTAKMKSAGFSTAAATPHSAPVDFAGPDDLIAFRTSFGWQERELAEMGDDGQRKFHADLEERFAGYRQDGRIRLRWSVMYYEATK